MILILGSIHILPFYVLIYSDFQSKENTDTIFSHKHEGIRPGRVSL